MVSVAYGQERILGVELEVCIHPPAIFRNVFDAHNFSVILNLFDSNMPYALSMHNQNCAKKMHHIREAPGIKMKHLQNLPENYLKSTKIAITACKISKISGGACPRTPRAFLVSPSASN